MENLKTKKSVVLKSALQIIKLTKTDIKNKLKQCRSGNP